MTVDLRQPPGPPRRAEGPIVVSTWAHRTAGTYRRRRTVAGLLLAGAIGAVVLVAGSVLTGPGGVPANAAGAGTAQPARTVRARVGDSLWSIATRFHGDAPIGRYVDALVSANGGTRIEAGQAVRLP